MAGIALGLIGSFPTPVTSSFESIATLTASGGETSLTFSNIPSTYKHLEIRGIARDTIAEVTPVGVKMRFNSDTGSNYVRHNLRGDGANVAAQGQTGFDLISFASGSMNATTSSNIFGASIITIADYASTTKNKTVRGFNGSDANAANANYQIALNSGLWLNTAAITSITMLPGQTAFAAGSVFSLYGIKG
jgi:hypothetical protein